MAYVARASRPWLITAKMAVPRQIVERALKKCFLHRKNSLFYKTENGAEVGDLFMSLIHTRELNEVNPFEYLIALQKHAEELAKTPAGWMPWNYAEALAPSGARGDSQ